MSAQSHTPRLFASLLGARLIFGFAYLASSFQRWPTPWYEPLQRRFTWSAQAPQGLAMEWYGRTFSALLLSLIGFFCIWHILGHQRLIPKPSFLQGAAKAVALLIVLDFCVFGWLLFQQAPSPLPLPSPACVP